MAILPPLPEGATLDEPQEEFAGGLPPLPEGATLDAAPAPEPQTGFWEQFGRKAVQVPTLGFADELGSYLNNTRIGLGGVGTDWDAYYRDLGRFRERERLGDEERPYTSAAGILGGAVLSAPLVPIKALQAGNLATRAVRGAKVGAGVGAVQGFGEGENNGVDRFWNAVGSVPAGAAGGAVGELGASAISRLFRGKRVPTDAEARQAAAKKFGVDLSRAEATRDVKDTAIEETLRKDGNPTMTRFDADTIGQMREAEKKIGNELGGGIVEAPEEAADVVLSGIRAREAAAKQGVTDAYQAADKMGAKVPVEVLARLPGRITAALQRSPLMVEPANTPLTLAYVNTLERDIARLTNLGDSPAQVTAVKLMWLDAQRKKIGTTIASIPNPHSADALGLKTAKRAIDDFLGDTINASLMSGDDAAIDMLKQARGLHAEYARRYRQKTGPNKKLDAAGREIERWLRKDDVTSEQVASKLFAQLNMNMGQDAAALAQRVKTIIGSDSPEWAAMRQGMWMRVLTPVRGGPEAGPQMLQKRINQFVDTSLAKRLYSPKERSLMKAYAADVLANKIPVKAGTNPSQTSYPVVRAMRENVATMLGNLLGFKLGGGPVGAMFGGIAAKWGAAQVANITGAIRANRAIKGAPTTGDVGRLSPGRLTPTLAPELGKAVGAPYPGWWKQEEEQGGDPVLDGDGVRDLPFGLVGAQDGSLPPLDLGPDPGGTGRPEGTTFDDYRLSNNFIDVTRPGTPNRRINQAFEALPLSALRRPVPGYTPPTGRVRNDELEQIRNAYLASMRGFDMGGNAPRFGGPLFNGMPVPRPRPPIGGMPTPIPRQRPQSF